MGPSETLAEKKPAKSKCDKQKETQQTGGGGERVHRFTIWSRQRLNMSAEERGIHTIDHQRSTKEQPKEVSQTALRKTTKTRKKKERSVK